MPAIATALRRVRPSQFVLWLLCAMYFLFYVDRVNISTAATSIQHDLHLSNTEIGLAFSAFAYPYAFFQIFGGWIADRAGPRRTLLWGGLVVAIATMATGLVGGLGSLFLVRLLLGFGEGSAFPTATRAMATWIAPTSRGWAQGATHSAARLGNAVTPPVVTALILAGSWRISFAIVGAASLVWVALWGSFFRDDPKDHSRISAEEVAALEVNASRGEPRPTPWRALIRRIAPATMVDFCYGWMLWMFLNWLPALFQTSFGLDLKKSALFASAVLFAGVVGDTVGGVLSDAVLQRTGRLALARGGVIAAGLLGAATFLLPLLVLRDITWIAVCLGFAFFSLELVVAPIWAVPMDIAPEHAGKASGLMNLGFGVAGIVSPPVVGAIIDLTGSRTMPFAAAVLLLLLGAALTLRLHPERRLEEGEA